MTTKTALLWTEICGAVGNAVGEYKLEVSGLVPSNIAGGIWQNV